jgi:hypothetical protein
VLAASIIGVVMMEAASTSETTVNFYQAAWHNIPEDSHLKKVNSFHKYTQMYYDLTVHSDCARDKNTMEFYAKGFRLFNGR